MTFGERLNSYLSQLDQKQSAVAVDWLERYKKRNPKADWATETVVSHLNRCLKEKREGVKFFFGHDASRADVLLETLRVPQAEQSELRRLAIECMEKEGTLTHRLVIDATTWGGSREQSEPLFDSLKVTVLQPAEKLKLTPVALVITEQQYDWLPRSYDRLGDWLVIEQVKDEKEGLSLVQKLAADSALVASSRRYQPVERWLAMDDASKKALVLEPAQGLELFAAEARLPAPLPKVVHPLQQIAMPAANTKAAIPTRPTELRRMMLALGDEAQVVALKLSPAERLALANALGVPATSTERERLEHELAGLAGQVGVAPKSLTQPELDQILTRAQRREVEFLLMRVGDQLHILNPPPNTSLPTSQRLIIHRMKSRRPAINRLMEVIDSWTADDYAADRGLMRVIERLDPKREERLAFLHARACLLWSSGLCAPTAPTPLPDWRAGLSKLLAGEPPAAQLRLFVEAKARVLSGSLGHHVAPYVVLQQELEGSWPAFIPDTVKSLKEPVANLLQFVPVRETLTVNRGQSVYLLDSYDRNVEGRGQRGQHTEYAASYYSVAGVHENYSKYGIDRYDVRHGEVEKNLLGLPSILIPHAWELLRKGDLWLDLFDGSRALSGTSSDSTSMDRLRSELIAKRLSPIEAVKIYKAAVEFPRNIWDDADQELGLFWLALKNALAQGNAVRMHDGIVLLSMGSGLLVRINIRNCTTVDTASAEEREVRACVDARVRHGTRKSDNKEQDFWGVRLDRPHVATHHATTTGYSDITATTTLGYELPKLYLAGHGLRGEVTFLTSPLFLSYGGATPPIAGLAAAGAQALVTAQRDNQKRDEEAANNDDDD